MKILPLGIGGALSKTHYNTNFLVETSDGKKLLVDCGYTAFRSLLDLGLSFDDIDGVFVTHIHGDHVLGLERLAVETQIVAKRKIPMYVPEEIAGALWDNVLKGLIGGTWTDRETGKTREKGLEDFFDVHLVNEDAPFEALGLSAAGFSVPHLKGRPTFGYLLQEGTEGSVAMLVPDAHLEKEYMEVYGSLASVIFHDCFSVEPKLPSHTAFTELVRMPEELRNKVILIHGDDGELENIDDLQGMRVAKQHEWYDV